MKCVARFMLLMDGVQDGKLRTLNCQFQKSESSFQPFGKKTSLLVMSQVHGPFPIFTTGDPFTNQAFWEGAVFFESLRKTGSSVTLEQIYCSGLSEKAVICVCTAEASVARASLVQKPLW